MLLSAPEWIHVLSHLEAEKGRGRPLSVLTSTVMNNPHSILSCEQLCFPNNWHATCMVCAQLLSHIRLPATPWTVARQAPLSMECSRQEYWSGLPFPAPGDLPEPGVKLSSLVSPALAARFFTTAPPGSPDLLYGYFLTFLKTFNISTSLHCPAIWKGFLHLVNSYLLFQAHLTPKMAMPTQLTPNNICAQDRFFHPAPQSQSETGCLQWHFIHVFKALRWAKFALRILLTWWAQ